ncbi:MAG: hypothetical protein COC24_012275 [Alphaproteobacteria bacterium]|nr:hypothetical protein [Alphaproteobacteria bacterium]
MEFTFLSDYWQASLLLPFMLILIGTNFQVAAGVGLGLVAGPGLLFVFDPIIAVQIAIVINLFLSVLLLTSEHKNIDFKYSNSLSAWYSSGFRSAANYICWFSKNNRRHIYLASCVAIGFE